MKTEVKSNLRRAVALAFAGAIAVGATSMTEVAYAQSSGESDQLEEVIITAERREQDVQKIAASVSVRTGEDLTAQGRYTLEEILENIPGMQGGASVNVGTVAGSGTDSPANGVVIRGIRSNTGAAGSITSVASSAATYVDDVYQGIGGGYDIGRVEVLRGPQGTLYGRSAVSGAVGTYTNNPDFDGFGGSAQVEVGANEVGARHSQRLTGALNVPLTDTFAIRVAANRYSQGGLYLDRSSGKQNQSAGKIKALYKPTDDLSILVAAAIEKNKRYSGGDGITITQPTIDQVVVTEAAVGAYYPGYNESRQLWAKLDWNLGFGTLTYVPAMRSYTSDQFVDNAANNVDCRTLTVPQLAPFSAIYNPAGASTNGSTCVQNGQDTPFDQFDTHEIRLASNPDSKLVWQAGGMYYLNRLRQRSATEFVSPVDGRNSWPDSCLDWHNYTNANGAQIATANTPGGTCTKAGGTKYGFYSSTRKETEALGAFAEATYPFTDTFRFTGGLRYDNTTVTTNQFYYTHRVASCLGDKSLYVDLGATGVTDCSLLADPVGAHIQEYDLEGALRIRCGARQYAVRSRGDGGLAGRRGTRHRCRHQAGDTDTVVPEADFLRRRQQEPLSRQQAATQW